MRSYFVVPLNVVFQGFEFRPVFIICIEPSFNLAITLGVIISTENLFDPVISTEILELMVRISIFITCVGIEFGTVICDYLAYHSNRL